ncbi:MAG TPA: permease prefix domain 1-containing protein, partial [Candidatus Limnocylindrales bacterium]
MDELRWDGLVTFESRIDDAIVGALQGQDLSGFEIWRWLGSKEGASGPLTEALLYPTLYHLEAEGLLQSAWHEGEWTKRKYRLTATASGQTSRGDQRVPAAPPADRRAVSPDPEAGAWFMPPRELPPAASPAAATATPAAAESSARRRPDAPGWAALATYADDLGARLDLPRAEQNRVRQEIADHLRDSAHSLERQGHDPEAATTEALRRLG